MDFSTPKPELYRKFGNPHRVAEFRLFTFNSCGAGCKNCFYQKSNNNYSDFDSVLKLAQDLQEKEYTLESCYMLPTDVFENEFNFQIFDNPKFIEVLGYFNYVGLASTLRNGFDEKLINQILSMNNNSLKIEFHINLREDLLADKDYILDLEQKLTDLKKLFGENVLINLALNLGTRLTDEEHLVLQRLVALYSDDKILEMNFTFMFNSKMDKETKVQYLKQSYPTIQYFTKEYAKVESEFNQRTLLRKPNFVFKDGNIYLTPILPFDEYVYLDEETFKLKDASFDSFLNTYAHIEALNIPILEECNTCEKLEYCHGKTFFSLAQTLNLPCIKQAV